MKKFFFFYVFFILINNSILSLDNPHFYRANYFFGEPRLIQDYLTSAKFEIAYGTTRNGLDGCSNETNILNIFGEENFHEIAHGVPNSILDEFPNSILNNLWEKNSTGCFGKLRFSGKFSAFECALGFQQNLLHGLFVELNIPFKRLKIDNITLKDLSTEQNAGTQVDFDQWQKFILNFDQNMSKYGICTKGKTKSGLGDITFFVGLAYDYSETEFYDFLDFTIKGGFLLPTGNKKNPRLIFDLPLGYDGHFGIPFSIDFSMGAYEWITIGLHAGFLEFFERTKNIAMKTSKKQNGLIKLAQGMASVVPGTIWTLGCYFKMDHFTPRLSFTFAYRFDEQRRTRISPIDKEIFNYNIVNCDNTLLGWTMHSLNFIFEYDLATCHDINQPHIEAFINLPISGKRIFKTEMYGAGIGIDYTW